MTCVRSYSGREYNTDFAVVTRCVTDIHFSFGIVQQRSQQMQRNDGKFESKNLLKGVIMLITFKRYSIWLLVLLALICSGCFQSPQTSDGQDVFYNQKLTLYAAGPLNLRSAPSTDAPVLFVIPKHQAVQQLATNGTWSEVEVNGSRGFVATIYLDVRAPQNDNRQLTVSTSPDSAENDTLRPLPDFSQKKSLIGKLKLAINWGDRPSTAQTFPFQNAIDSLLPTTETTAISWGSYGQSFFYAHPRTYYAGVPVTFFVSGNGGGLNAYDYQRYVNGEYAGPDPTTLGVQRMGLLIETTPATVASIYRVILDELTHDFGPRTSSSASSATWIDPNLTIYFEPDTGDINIVITAYHGP